MKQSNSIAIDIQSLHKTYDNGFSALKGISLDVKLGEIFALLGPNGAGKTTLINSVCGIVQPSRGKIKVCGYDHQAQYKQARSCIGLVPQELATDSFESVWKTVSFSRGLFGKAKNPAYIEDVLKRLSLWDKKDEQIRKLSGGMKRRVMIAKALSHEPRVLFLDEPSAGVDVELRKSMWDEVRALREMGVTIILTTHYIEEAEVMADRIGIINHGELVLTEATETLIHKMGDRQMIFHLHQPMQQVPQALNGYQLALTDDGYKMTYTYDASLQDHDISALLAHLSHHEVRLKDITSRQSTLEEIFIQLVGEK